MIALQVQSAAASAAEADAAIAALEDHEGLYFGVDAGVAGIHPLQAVACARPALRLRVWEDGLECLALTAFGQQVLDHDSLRSWRGKLGRGLRSNALDLAREFLTAFEPSADVMLVGALRFEAWRLATRQVGKAHLAAAPSDAAIGTLWFPEQLLRRDAQGAWTSKTFVIPAKAGTPGFPAVREKRTPEFPTVASLPPAGMTTGDDHPPGAYADMVRRAIDLLRTRPLDSLTLSQSYRRRVPIGAREAFARLRAVNPAPACFFVNEGAGERLFGASPDLQLVVRGREVSSIPVCGTVARQPGPEGEAASIRELLANQVDAAALAVCSRAMGEDLQPLCEPGSVRVTHRQQPMALATVVHALDRVEGRLRDDADAWDCIAATGAPVMLTGTPRAEALRGIAELEASPRGWYGGLVLQVASNGDAAVGTILRAAAVRGDIAEVRTGGDLLADSDPAREEEESRLKTRSLWRAFGIADQAMRIDSRWLPPTSSKLLMATVIVLSLPYAALGIALLGNVGRAPVALVVSALFLLLAWGLWRLKKWARWITVGVLWLVAIPLPFGVLSPFSAADWEGGAPHWSVLAAVLLPLVAASLFCLHVLGKHKGEFRW